MHMLLISMEASVYLTRGKHYLTQLHVYFFFASANWCIIH